MPLDLTLVVPAHDEAGTVLSLLREVDAQLGRGSSIQAVVCDDASDPPLEAALKSELFSSIELSVVRRESNGGPGAARNTALRSVNSEWVVFLDADERPGSGWVDRLKVHLDATDSPDFIEGLVRPADGSEVTPFQHTIEADASKDQHVGGNILCRRTMLSRVGGFSEEFFDSKAKLHFREDADFWFRLQDAGVRSIFDPEMVVEHPLAKTKYFLPMKLSRRYYFDPLLSKKHPARFGALMGSRRVGPISLRRARHLAAFGHVLVCLAALLIATATKKGKSVTATALVATTSVNALALSRGTSVPLRFLPLLALNGFAAPFVYAFKFIQGAYHFRHWPKF